MVLSKEGANLPVFTADNSEGLQDKKKKPGEELGSEVSSLAPAYTIKEKINWFFFWLPNIHSHFSIVNIEEAKPHIVHWWLVFASVADSPIVCKQLPNIDVTSQVYAIWVFCKPEETAEYVTANPTLCWHFLWLKETLRSQNTN